MFKEILQKMVKYYLGVIKKFGIVIPAVIAGVGYAAVLAMDLLDVPTLLLQGSVAGFVIVAIVLFGAFGFGAYYTIKNLGNKEYALQDLGLSCIAAIGVLTVLTFLFTSGWNGMSVTKWLVILGATALCVVLSFFRTKNID